MRPSKACPWKGNSTRQLSLAGRAVKGERPRLEAQGAQGVSQLGVAVRLALRERTAQGVQFEREHPAFDVVVRGVHIPKVARQARQGLSHQGNRVYIMPMSRAKREGYSRVNIMLRDELKEEIRKKWLPYEGAKDLSSFLELGAEHLIEEVKAKRKPRRQNP